MGAKRKAAGQKPSPAERTISLLTGRTELEEKALRAEQDVSETARNSHGPRGSFDALADGVAQLTVPRLHGKSPSKREASFQIVSEGKEYILMFLGKCNIEGHPYSIFTTPLSHKELGNLKEAVESVYAKDSK